MNANETEAGAVRVRTHACADVDEIAAALTGLQARMWVADRPSGAAWKLLDVDVGGFRLMHGEMAGGFCGAAGVHERSLLVAVKLDATSPWNLHGCPVTEDEIAVIRPGTEYTLRTAAPGEWALVRLDALELEGRLTEMSEGGYARLRGALHVLRPAAEPLRALRAAVYRLIGASRAEAQASRLDGLTAALHAQILETVGGAMLRWDPAPRENDARVVRRALSYLEEHQGRAVYVSDLCAAGGCSERALRRAFNAVYDSSPIAFIRARHLNHARRALLAGRCQSVTEAAMQYSFYDVGRFSATYRKLFGELPSKTAERQRALTAD
ncbi:MAG TPA: helix-turn-helix domain-containing protein [Burkholderiales bacterium]|nr:helix-turn-helix domain-containing protein [Burkholderiales bacterium]